MNDELLYSIRMRASSGGRHLSGAERIVAATKKDRIVKELMDRAHSKGAMPDEVVITMERVMADRVRSLDALDVIQQPAQPVEEARATAMLVLEKTGVSRKAAAEAIRLLANGPAPSGGNMRGAMIMDCLTGERLEPDPEKGVRASRFDWEDNASREADGLLDSAGLVHFRTKEALALATKIAYAPGIAAELCWSDDSGYTAGYVASRATGYVRFPALKPPESTRGGRVFFVDKAETGLERFIAYLQEQPVLITKVGRMINAERREHSA